MSRYPWARSFIKQARLFSIILVICGLIVVGFQSWNLENQIRAKTYHPNMELSESFQDLSHTLQESRNIISIFQQSTGGVPVSQSIGGKLDLLPAYDSDASLNLANGPLESASDTVYALKQFLIVSVQQNLGDLVKQLRAHAASLTPDSNSNIPTTPPSPHAPSATSLRGLFAEEVTQTEAEQRKAQLQQVQDSLNVLSKQTEKPENQNKLQSSISEVRRLEGLLAYLTVPAELTTTTANLQPSNDTNAPPPPQLSASKIADLLEEEEAMVSEAITSRWLVDEKIIAAKAILQREQRAAIQAKEEIAELYMPFYENVFITLILTAILAYLLQIAADILQAHIDNADNSFPGDQSLP